MLVIEVFKNSIKDFQNSMQISGNLFIEIRFSILISIFDFKINDSQVKIYERENSACYRRIQIEFERYIFIYSFFKIKYINLLI